MATYTAIDAAGRQLLAKRLHSLGCGELRALTGVPAGSVNSNYRIETERLGPGAEAREIASADRLPMPADPAFTTAGRYFLRLYEEQDAAGAAGEAKLLEHLASCGVPTPAPLSWTNGQDEPLIEIAGRPAALFPWVDGEMRCQASVTVDDASAVGAALAKIHVAGRDIESALGAGRFRSEDLYIRLDRIASAPEPELAAQAAPIRARLTAAVAARDPHLPTGLVHGDLFRDNVLWSAGASISALLDFESASRGVFAYDLAVTVLAWTFGHGFDADLARAMIAGYQSVRPLTPIERRGFAAECAVAALRFTITRITDYAMRAASAKASGDSRVMKDWRRFDARARAIETSAARLEAEWMPTSST